MRKLFLSVVLATSAMSLHAEDVRPDMSRYTMAYSGGAGFQVWLARIGPKENQEALVQINGIDHQLDGRVVRARIILTASGAKYLASVGGKSYELLQVQGSKAELLLTGMPWSSELFYDQKLVADRPPQHLLSDYLDGARSK